MRVGSAIVALWVTFALSWLAAAWWRNPLDAQVGTKREIPYRIVLLVGGLVLLVPAHGYSGPWRLWPVTRDEAWVCAALIAVGFAFSWWARIQLGALWSGPITKRANHRVIDTGPYAIVRHPIYTGILLSIYATAAVKGTAFGIAGASIITLGLWMKARLEERWLGQALEPGAYEAYRRRVPMLLPFGPKGGVTSVSRPPDTRGTRAAGESSSRE
jgi:protein-S-isoprenylcysteine O-methyltransferase Ste14